MVTRNKIVKRMGLGFLVAVFLSLPVVAQYVVRWSVTVPVDYTITYKTDSGDKRLHVLTNGATIHPWNFGPYDSLTVRRDPAVSEPLLGVCNNTGSDVTIHFFEVDESGECPDDPDEYLEVQLGPGECFTDPDADCAMEV